MALSLDRMTIPLKTVFSSLMVGLAIFTATRVNRYPRL
jgi:hypothetical protein